MHGGVMCEGHSCLKTSLMHDGRTHTNTRGDTITHTNEQNMHGRGHTRLSSGEMCLLDSFPFTAACANTRRPLTCPFVGVVFLCICTLSQARLILIFMSWAWRPYYYYHYCYYAFRGREITLCLAEAVQKRGLSLLQSSDWSDLWFMQAAHCLR